MINSIFRRKRKPVSRDSGPSDLSIRYPDATPLELAIIRETAQTTMTSPERLLALIRAVQHIVHHQLPGDLVECGVWRGGSMFAMARTLIAAGDTSRNLWLYDTFQGMSMPSERDVDFCGAPARDLLVNDDLHDPQGVWCYSTLEEVQTHLQETGYAAEKFRFIVGPVESTLHEHLPDQISLLRLDTDWYESTRCELELLFPRLVSGGVLIIDDYGHWQGCRKAVDEYFAAQNLPILLNRIDYTGRIAVKP